MSKSKKIIPKRDNHRLTKENEIEKHNLQISTKNGRYVLKFPLNA